MCKNVGTNGSTRILTMKISGKPVPLHRHMPIAINRASQEDILVFEPDEKSKMSFDVHIMQYKQG